MKYNRIKNNYLISCVCSIVLLLLICYFGMNYMVKGTFAGFGGLSGCMSPTIKVNYLPNYPEGFKEPDAFLKMSCETHKVLNNMFDTPSGYEFNGWNSSADGSGKIYNVGVFTIISEETTIYAQWKLLPQEEPEEEIINYGDVNENGEIDEGDYLLIEKYLSDSTVLTDNLLTFADVNGDGKINEVDVDIVKQVCLGTTGYTGYLPEKIVPIYSIYVSDDPEDNEDDSSNEGDAKEEDDKEGDSSSGNIDSGTGTGSGNGSSGTGTSSGGTSSGNLGTGGSSNNKPSNNSSSGNNSNNNKDKEEDKETENDKEEIVEPKKVVYNFRFMNEDNEYANTSCETIEGSTCELVLPNDNPTKKDYIFVGWDTLQNCSSKNKINNSIMVNLSNTYYACFIVNASSNKDYSAFTVGLIIFMIWVCAIFSIYLLVKRFKNTEVKG